MAKIGSGKCSACGEEVNALKKVGNELVCPKCAPDVRSRQFKENFEEQQKAKEAKRRREFYVKRIDVAQKGRMAYKLGNAADAIRNYILYFDVLEEYHKCGRGGLHPKFYNQSDRNDAAELLLITAIYWDMVKIYDRARNQDKEFRDAAAKLTMFVVGMPYQVLIADNIRKYILANKCVRKSAFKSLYAAVKPAGKCYIATAVYGSPCDSRVIGLQAFRDNTLRKSFPGRLFIDAYYGSMHWLEPIVKNSPVFQKIIRTILGVIR